MQTLLLILPLAWRNLWRNRRRTALTVSALGIAVSSMVIAGAFIRAWSASAFETSIENLTGHGQIHAPGYVDDPVVERLMNPPDGATRAVLDGPEVRTWAERVRVPAMVRSERETYPVSLVGIDPVREAGLSFIANAVSQGHPLADVNDPGIVLGSRLAELLKTGVGRRVVIMAQGAQGDIRESGFRVVGLFSRDQATEKGFAFVSVSRAQALLELGGRISEISFKVRALERLPEVVQALRRAAPGRDTRSWDELQPVTKAMIEMNRNVINIWIYVAFTVVSFGLVNSLLMAVHERIREFGLLQALGMKPRWLLLQMLVESTILIAVGTLVGLLVGGATVWHYRHGVSLGLGAEYLGSAAALYPRLDLHELELIGLTVIGLGLVASLYPALKAAQKMPLEILSRATN